MNQIAVRLADTPAANYRDMAKLIARQAPTLKDLNSEQLEQIAKICITQRLAAEMDTAAVVAGVDYEGQKKEFLDTLNSDHTRRTYNLSLEEFEAWAKKAGINPLEINPAAAKKFIRENTKVLTGKTAGKNKPISSQRRDIAAVSSFYSLLHENTNNKIINPFLNFTRSKIKPKKETKKDIVIPTAPDMNIIIDNLPAVERAAVITMAKRGLRIGSLVTLELKGKKYHGISKGKELKENNHAGITLPPECVKAIQAAGLDIKKPFAKFTTAALESRINKKLVKMHKAEKIKAAYSCHDFRHYFAVSEYTKTKDIYRVSKLLNHANITITETYLQSLNIEL